MEQIIVAFEKRENCERIRELLESGGEFSCLPCQSGAQVRRLLGGQATGLVVCGFKLADESCEALYGDLPPRCAMLMVAPQARLELCEAAGVFKLPTPLHRSELLASVRLLAQLIRAWERTPTQRTQADRALVAQAKEALMTHGGMTEEEAHRFLQKQSMDHRAPMADTARHVLREMDMGKDA